MRYPLTTAPVTNDLLIWRRGVLVVSEPIISPAPRPTLTACIQPKAYLLSHIFF